MPVSERVAHLLPDAVLAVDVLPELGDGGGLADGLPHRGNLPLVDDVDGAEVRRPLGDAGSYVRGLESSVRKRIAVKQTETRRKTWYSLNRFSDRSPDEPIF